MSQVEESVATVVRLLRSKMQVVKDDGSLASIYFSSEWYDRELFKNYDGQVTVGLSESNDQKLELAGRLRRRMAFLRVNAWSMNRIIRGKMVEEISQVVRLNRQKPNETLFDFAGVGQTTTSHKAYSANSSNELSPDDPAWTELAEDYSKIWYSDDVRYNQICLASGEYPQMLFRFKIDLKADFLKMIVLAFEGWGTAPAGSGVTVKIWNHAANAWQHAQTGTGSNDETIIINLVSDLADYFDENSLIYLLARTSNPSDGQSEAVLHCDYASCRALSNGISYLDIVSFRDADRVDVKPFLYRTEFVLKSWLFENLGE